MLKLKFVFFIMISLYALSASASEVIRVVVADDQKTVIVKSEAGVTSDGVYFISSGKRTIFKNDSFGTAPKRVASRGAFIQVNGRSYRGWIEIRKKQNGLLLVINELDIEDYLKGVVAAEIPHDWEFEALKAQAVASRTYALYQKRKTGARPYHILATVDSQVYGGKSGERETAIRAVRETEGIVITHAGEVIPAFYHSSCGGHTENAFELWGIDAPYLRGVDCECQEISKYGLWEKRIPSARVAGALRSRGYHINSISGIGIDGITSAGRVKQIALRHSGGFESIPAERFRAAIGYSSVPSVFFETELSGNEVVISGRGLGHGVGLCQWGAREMAQRGYDYSSILSYYYPGTKLLKRENQ